MKKTLFAIVVAIIAMVTVATPASAQFRIGPKIGLNVNGLHFDKSIFDSENRAGFTGGIMTEFTVPLIGVGADLSAMYVRRTAEWMNSNADKENASADYIAIPLNLKWKIGNILPGIKSIVNPFITTGPEFAFLCSKRTFKDIVKRNNCDVAWNVGFGVELFTKVQVAASYGFGMTKVWETISGTPSENRANIDAKNRYWTITAAYLF